MLLVKSSVLYESIRPYLEALQTRDPAVVTFSNILVHGVDLARVSISPPTFASTPGFEWNLSCLLPKDVDIGGPLTFSVNDPSSLAGARELLKAHGTLDASQADAMIDVLSREVALVQGPPGTGKTVSEISIPRIPKTSS